MSDSSNSTSQQDADLAALAAAADEIGSAFAGMSLRYDNGHWYVVLAKDKKIEVSGRDYVVDANSYACGFVKWEKRRRVINLMARRVDGWRLPLRNQLGDTDEETWPSNSKGDRVDPWNETHQLVFKALEAADNDNLLIWATTSWGGKQALAAFLKEYPRQAKAHPDEMPVVRLASRDENHPDFGKIGKPVLEIIGWQPFGGGASGPGNRDTILPTLPNAATPAALPDRRKPMRLAGNDMDDDIPFQCMAASWTSAASLADWAARWPGGTRF